MLICRYITYIQEVGLLKMTLIHVHVSLYFIVITADVIPGGVMSGIKLLPPTEVFVLAICK